mgnify:CR=1 FL=1
MKIKTVKISLLIFASIAAMAFLRNDEINKKPIYLNTAYYSADGEAFKILGTDEALLKDIRVGLITCDGVITQSMTRTYYFDSDTTKPDTPFNVSFDYFHITNSGLK